MKHSQAPWQIVSYGDGESFVIHDARGDYRVCFMATPGSSPDSLDRIEANARLIAAAPDLVTAGQDMLIAFAEGINWSDPGKREAYEAFAAAIAKALGEPTPL